MSSFRKPHSDAKHLARLKRVMSKRKVTGLDLASLMGRPNQLISEIFTLKTNITIETAVQLKESLDIDPRTILREQLDFQIEQYRLVNGDWQ